MADQATIEANAKAELEDRIRKSVTKTAAMMADRKVLNDRIKEEREKICEQTGLHPRAYQDEVRNFRIYTPGERADYMSSRKVMMGAMEGHEKDLFGEDIINERDQRAAKRAEQRDKGTPQDGSKLTQAEDERGDPNKGGAAKAHQDNIAKAKELAEQTEQAEQAEGESILAGKSEAWRTGFNAHGAALTKADMPHIEGSAEARDWLAGYTAAADVAFNEAGPVNSGETEPPSPPSPPADEPVSDPAPAKAKRPQNVVNIGQKKSQSQKASEKLSAAKLN